MLLLFYEVSRMLNFYDVKEDYAEYLRKFEHRIPNIHYASNNKFVCGIVLTVNGFDYFAPISSSTFSASPAPNTDPHTTIRFP